MAVRACKAILLLSSWLTMGAATAAITPAELDQLIAELQTFYPIGTSGEVLTILRAQLPRTGFSGAVSQIAKEWNISLSAADAVVTAVALREIHLVDDEPHAAADGKSPYQLLLDALRSDAQSEKVWEVMRDELSGQGACGRDNIAARYFARPGAAAKFLRSERDCDEWILDYAKSQPMTPLAYFRVATLARLYDTEYRLAALQDAVQDLRDKNTDRAANSVALRCLTRMYWAALAQADLGSRIVADADHFARESKLSILAPEELPTVALEGADIKEECATASQAQAALLFALVDAGRTDDARSLIADIQLRRPTSPDRRGQPNADIGVVGVQNDAQSEFLYRAIDPTSNDDIYDLFIGDGSRGLLWTVGNQTPLSQRVSIKLFARNGYGEIAADLKSLHCRMRSVRKIDRSLQTRIKNLPPDFIAASARLAQLMNQARIDPAMCGVATQRISRGAARRVYEERDLPATQQSKHNDSEFTAELKVAGLESVHVVRIDRDGSQWAALSVSNFVDPTGEVGLGGYWLHLSQDQGHSWEPPIYTGLQYMQPYVIPTKSKLHLLRGRTLTLEVMVRELDEESIKFPPIGIATKRSRDGIYIELSLDQLMRDTDNDGLTDLLEEKLRTDPERSDSDGDGLADSIDPLPQASARDSPHADVDVVKLALQQVLHYDESAIRIGAPVDRGTSRLVDSLLAASNSPGIGSGGVLFLKADPSLFKGLVIPSRVIIVNDDDIAALRQRFGVFYPLEFPTPWFNHAHDKAVMQWSAGWMGGTLFFHKGAKGWESTVVDRWIS